MKPSLGAILARLAHHYEARRHGQRSFPGPEAPLPRSGQTNGLAWWPTCRLQSLHETSPVLFHDRLSGLGALAWVLVQKLRGLALAGYEPAAQPLVQTVVATGRVAAVSRAQVGSPVTGMVVGRRVQEGDIVQPGDVLAALRADDFAAAVGEAQAALAQLQESTRPPRAGYPARGGRAPGPGQSRSPASSRFRSAADDHP